MTTPVLICDDSALARKQMARSLPASLNAEVTFAHHGKEAMALMHAQRFSIMFLDLTMPEMDGYQTLEAMQSAGIDLPVIVVSADVQPEAQKRVFALGAKGFIRKPIDKPQLIELLKTLVSTPEADLDAVIRPVVVPKLKRRDIYMEVANVAIGRAADALARHFDVFVELPLPNVNLFEVSELHMTMRHLVSNDAMSGVCQGFSGEGIAGEALVLLSDGSVNQLSEILNYPSSKDFDNELELLMDISNIMVGSFLQGIGEQAAVRFFQSHPVLLGQHVPVEDLIEKTSGNWRKTMTFEVSYAIEKTEIKCDLLLMFVDESLPLLDNKLAYLMEDH